MKTINKEITLYSVSDLKENPIVLKNVLDKQYHINVEIDFWYEGIIDNHTQKLESLGFNEVKIAFTGFGSQGDGASFTCNSIDFKKWLSENSTNNNNKRLLSLLNKDLIELDGNIKRDRYTHYCHWNTTTLYLSDSVFGEKNSYPNIESTIEQLDKDITNFMQSYNKKIYKDLDNTYDELTAEKAILETLEANDYEFTEDGNIYC